jgi:hypothetical protein
MCGRGRLARVFAAQRRSQMWRGRPRPRVVSNRRIQPRREACGVGRVAHPFAFCWRRVGNADHVTTTCNHHHRNPLKRFCIVQSGGSGLHGARAQREPRAFAGLLFSNSALQSRRLKDRPAEIRRAKSFRQGDHGDRSRHPSPGGCIVVRRLGPNLEPSSTAPAQGPAGIPRDPGLQVL